MSDDCINLVPITTINTFTSVVEQAKRKFTETLNLFGTYITLQRNNSKTLDATGNVIDFDTEYMSVRAMIFDRFNSDALKLSGMSKAASQTSGIRTNPRAYVDCDADVLAGDFLLINFNSTNDTYTEKYRILEKQAHDVGDATVFFTLYLEKEKI